MKKSIFSLLILQFLIIATAIPSYAFELYGCWKSDQEDPFNVIRFDKNKLYYGRKSLPVEYSQNAEMHIVSITAHSKIHIIPDSEDAIRVTFANQSLPKNIVYKRISEDEAMKLIKKR